MKLRNLALKISSESALQTLRIVSPELQDTVFIFRAQCERLLELLGLPEGLLACGIGTVAATKSNIAAQMELVLKAVSEGRWKSISDKLSFTPDEVKYACSELKNDFLPQDMSKAISDELQRYFSYNPEWHSAITLLKSTALISAWTVFETVSKDVWTIAINARPMIYGQPTFKNIQDKCDEGGLSAKTISVGLAARYGFDLRACLGTLLSDRFAFTSVDGITKAYSASFKDISSIKTFLTELTLTELEKTRNLLVHRAGYIDETFKRLTGNSQPVGSELALSDEMLERNIKASFAATKAILEFVDKLLTKTNVN